MVELYTELHRFAFLPSATPLNVHRTLSSYVSAFLKAGFVLDGLREPIPSAEQLVTNPNFDDELRAPNFIIYEMSKPAS